MRSSLFRKLLLVWAVASVIAGCAGKTPSPVPTVVISEPVPITAPATAAVTPQLSPTPTLEKTPLPSTPSAVEETRASYPRPPSGWTNYSNPDFVQGVAVYERQLWAATLGGVVAWDLDTKAHRLYTTRDGLVEIQGNDVVYCPVPEKRILVAHSTGLLSAFDLKLKKWSRIPITFPDGGTLKGVRTLLCDAPNQRLIAGSVDGLGILNLKTGAWKRIGPAEGLKLGTIRAIDVVGQAIWVAAGDKSAFMIMGNTIFPFNAASGFPSGSVYDLSVAPDQSIWLGYSTGLVHYQDKKWNSFGAQTPSGIPFQSVDHVEVGPDKRIWIASSEEGICPFNPVTLFCSTVYTVTPDVPITDLVIAENGVAYAGTNGEGVMVLDSEKIQRLRFDQQQLMSNDILDIAESSDGKLWIATDLGVNSFNPMLPSGPWESIQPQREKLLSPRVTGLFPSTNGMWLFYDQKVQASFYDGVGWSQVDVFQGLMGPISDGLVDQRGYAWFATSLGINVWDGSVMRTYTPANDPRGNSFQSLYEQGDGIWAGSNHGLLHYQRYQWQLVLPDLSINAIAPNKDGGLLLGTDQGLVIFDGKQSFVWLINLGDEVLSNVNVTSITWDGNGHLWVGTDGHGLLHYDGNHWEQFNTANGLPTNKVRKVYTDRLGTVWIAAVTGEGGGALVRYVP